MSTCDHNCETCGQDCGERAPADLHAPLNELSRVGKVVAVVSGKGGVGKSSLTSLLACGYARRGHRAGILDADITGPSIPKLFGLTEKAKGDGQLIFPVVSRTGIPVMSLNLLLDDENAPVVWRGPILAGTVKQLWTDVLWEDIDCLFIDMPPGTGDVPLTVFQSLPLDGILMVTSPQELSGMIVSKAVNMARMMKVPILGLVENYSYLTCPDCGKQIDLFGQSHVQALADAYGLPVLARLPIDPALAARCDAGEVERVVCDPLEPVLDALEQL